MTTPNDQDRPPEMPLADPLRPNAAVTPTARTGAPNKLRIGAVTGAAVALAVGAVATSLAATPPAGSATPATTGPMTVPAAAITDPLSDSVEPFDHGRMGVHDGFRDITISAISGSSITLATDDGWTRTITITDGIELSKGGQEIALADLAVGDQVRIAQTRNDDGTYTVEAIAVVVPSVRGTVSDVSSGGFKVETRDGSVWTVTVDGSTEYAYGEGEGSLADVTDGTTVIVLGTETGDNALTALSVRVAADRAIGTVTSKTADTIVIERRDGTSQTVHVDADTTYRIAEAADADLGDVTVDMAIGVSGRERADGSIDADVVIGAEGRGILRGFGDGLHGFGDGRRGHGGPGLDDAAEPTASPSSS
jgi:hypothetical protein